MVQDLEPSKYELQMAEQKAFVLSVWSKVGGKQDVCSKVLTKRGAPPLMLCGLKKANNSLLLYYYILLQVLQQGHSRISNELRRVGVWGW